MDPIGKSPVPVPVLILSKLAMAGCWFIFLVRTFDIGKMFYDGPLTRGMGITLFVAGLCVVILSFIFLGTSLSVGLPEKETELKTRGVYRVSRNPMYMGAFLMCAGSCLFSVHLANLLLFAITIAVHHLIVIREEKFLEARFGQRWLEYKERVPRYVGIVGSVRALRISPNGPPR